MSAGTSCSARKLSAPAAGAFWRKRRRRVDMLRVLCAIANPSDLVPFDAARVWAAIAGALQSFIERDRVAIERASDVTEAGIRGVLQQNRVQVVHFVGHAQARAANYTTIALQSADGRARQRPASAEAQP